MDIYYVAQDTVSQVTDAAIFPNDQAGPLIFVPVLQREDGSYIGTDNLGFNYMAMGTGGGILWQYQTGSHFTQDVPARPLYATSGGGVIGVGYLQNLPPFDDQVSNRGCKCAADNERPPDRIDDIVAFNPDNPRVALTSTTSLKLAEPYTVAFHELAETFEKIDGGKGSYAEAHNAAIQREDRLRDQRPNLQTHNPGSGGPANGTPDHQIFIKR